MELLYCAIYLKQGNELVKRTDVLVSHEKNLLIRGHNIYIYFFPSHVMCGGPYITSQGSRCCHLVHKLIINKLHVQSCKVRKIGLCAFCADGEICIVH